MHSYRMLGAMLEALRDLSFPILLFGLTSVLGMSTVFALLAPDRFPVHIGDRVVRAGELTQEEKSLTAKQASLLTERDKLLTIAPTPVLHSVILEREKSFVASLAAGMNAINTVQRSFEESQDGAIDITTITSAKNSITVSGIVYDASGESIQLLARMTDALREQKIFRRVTEPEYQTIPGDDGATSSPFTIVLTFADA